MNSLIQRLITLYNFIGETETEDKESYQETITQAIKVVKRTENMLKEFKKCLNLF